MKSFHEKWQHHYYKGKYKSKENDEGNGKRSTMQFFFSIIWGLFWVGVAVKHKAILIAPPESVPPLYGLMAFASVFVAFGLWIFISYLIDPHFFDTSWPY